MPTLNDLVAAEADVIRLRDERQNTGHFLEETTVGREPLELMVGEWALSIHVKDPWTQVCITSPANDSTYVRISPDQARELRDYFNASLPPATTAADNADEKS